MLKTPVIVEVPLHTDANGVIRISNTRVTLETLIGYYLQGETPEDLHEGFPTVPLSDIYAVITYYLANQDDVDAYMQASAKEARALREQIESAYTPEQRARIERLRALRNANRKDEA
jgi:uncharacterized protein (DUF433 family)